MNRRLAFWVLLWFLSALGVSIQAADSYKLMNGNTMTGEPIAPDDRGIIFKLGGTTLSERIGWTNFTEGALQELAKDAKIKPFVEPWLLDDQQEVEAEKADRDIKPKRVERLDRPDPQSGLGSLLASPLSLVCLALLYLANLYSAFEIGVFRNYHPAMVCGLSAILPLLGPVIFLCLPTNVHVEGEKEAVPEEEAAEPNEAEGHAAGVAAAAIPHAAAPQGPAPPTIYPRGQFTFNRRFFETKLAGFARSVPDEKTKDMILCLESTRGNFVADRIARIDPNEVCLLVNKAGASAEVSIPFAEIKEIQVRHKDT